MQTYMLFTKLSTDLSYELKNRERQGRAWMEQVKDKCPEVKFLAHYAILGEYDFIDIYEAPDPETAAKVSIISQAHGAMHSKSLLAIPYKRFLELTDEI
jgi:uncharacterized protein with GYD domain